MELSTGQQRLLFAVVVLLLAGLGIYLLGPGTHHGAGASPTTSASSSPAVTASSPPTAVPPATVPPGTPIATSPGAGGTDIYQWLPFTQQDLTEAAQVTTAFAVDYDTFSYTETATAYAAKMANVVTAELAETLQNAYATPGVAAQRSRQKQISTSSGGITAIRSFGTGSITFLVNIVQRLATSTGTTTASTQYAVTVVSAAGGWEVDDIELADAGNS
ncbi:MAG TPA: hypothetical protein VNV62_07315 [Trebonia sp.]|jgi:hypothetical protein|nr:hypothetical protein [Trebonia sp.]